MDIKTAKAQLRRIEHLRSGKAKRWTEALAEFIDDDGLAVLDLNQVSLGKRLGLSARSLSRATRIGRTRLAMRDAGLEVWEGRQTRLDISDHRRHEFIAALVAGESMQDAARFSVLEPAGETETLDVEAPAGLRLLLTAIDSLAFHTPPRELATYEAELVGGLAGLINIVEALPEENK